MRRSNGDERHRRARGNHAERAVVNFLLTHGFEVLATNARFGPLEIDVIARREALLVFVEVRTRGPGAYVGPLASITPKKRATFLRAAERAWREVYSRVQGVERLRLDLAGVTFAPEGAQVEYVAGAFTA